MISKEIPAAKQVLVCQSRTCRKQGSAQVLAAFLAAAGTGITIVNSGCLGHCGQGPMVLILPGQIWYDQVDPAEVPALIQQHLLDFGF